LLNNVGTAFTGTIEFGTLSPLMLVLLSILMLAGRLELYAVLLPFSRSRNR
jgi:Trk-type K+ transport system membrane component